MKKIIKLIIEIGNDQLTSRISVKSFLISFFLKPSFRIMLNYRLGKYLIASKNIFVRLIGKYFNYRLVSIRSCYFSYSAIIGKKLKLPHPIGIVIGEGTIIKDNVTIFQQVTLGSHGKKSKKREYPIIENGVKIYAGAKILGNITIGENSIIGANSVVLENIPANSIAVGIPAKIKKKSYE